jgi:hypothetical protein
MTDDAERDAWLREALRHAPDSGAAPPSAISVAILAEARAAAARPMATSPAGRAATRAMPTHPWLAFWSWLARPPVAAGFASVMAATLVGLMWWDRPMDETLARPPVAASARSDAVPAAAPAAIGATAAASEAKEATAMSDARARANDLPAKDMQAKNAPAREGGAPPEVVAPAAFPARERGRATSVAPSAAAEDAKEEAAASRVPAPAPFTAQPAAPTAPAMGSPPASLPNGRLASDEARAAASNRADAATPAAAAKSIAPARPAPEPRSEAAPALRQRSPAEAQPNESDAFTSPGAGAHAELAASPRREGGASAAPLAPLLAALAGDSARGSRQTASDSAIALEPAWRAWLVDLDAAAAGRWQRTSKVGEQAAADADTQGTATLRVALDGQPAATVRLDGTTVLVETLGAAPARWQAALAPGSAARLRAALGRLPP